MRAPEGCGVGIMTGAAQAPEGGQLLRGHQQGGLLGSLEGGRTGAAATARRAPEGYGVGNMTGADQAPEGWGQGWTGWKLVASVL